MGKPSNKIIAMKARTKRHPTRGTLGDYPVMAFVRVGALPDPQTGVVDTFTRYSVLPRELAEKAGVKPTGKAGTLKIMRRAVRGELVRVPMASLDGGCRGETTALVPNKGENWNKGLLLGGEFLQDTGMHVGANGEAYCPVTSKRARAK